MSFLRALSSEALSSSSKSATNQAHSSVSNSPAVNHQNPHFQPSHSPSATSHHRRHHAKALLHPMALLLRRRSGQSNSANNEPSPISYGLARDLPDDFDPGIIYGTRHPDWSFPRKSVSLSTDNIVHSTNRGHGNLLSNSGTGGISQSGAPANDTTHPPKRQAFFTEHFGDVEYKVLDGVVNIRPSKTSLAHDEDDTHAKTVVDAPFASSLRLPGFIPPEEQSLYQESCSIVQDTNLNQGCPHKATGDIEGSPVTPSHYSDISLDPLRNSSRFSFEASSITDSARGEELTLSENILQRQYTPRFDDRRQSYDTGSFASDDVNSITSEDLLDEDGDGFNATYPNIPQDIAPPPGFENVLVDTLENTRILQQIITEETDGGNLASISPSVISTPSSEAGLNGSTTDEEGRGLDTGNVDCPPFINPPGGANHDRLVTWDSPATEPPRLENVDRTKSPILTFHNLFQTGTQGVHEYDSGSPSSLLELQTVGRSIYPSRLADDEEIEGEGDEDDMIAEANRDALASDSDGWYGQEFGFYPTSSMNSTYLAGGFFGVDLPKPGFVRNPSLTPISERSESSLRNSLSLINPCSITNPGISAGPLSTALLTELANNEQLKCDDTTFNQLQLLRGNQYPEDNIKHLAFFASSPSTVAPMARISDDAGLTTSISKPSPDKPSPSLVEPDEPVCNNLSEISTSYVHDIDLGWVMEKRRGGELIQRELVQGAV